MASIKNKRTIPEIVKILERNGLESRERPGKKDETMIKVGGLVRVLEGCPGLFRNGRYSTYAREQWTVVAIDGRLGSVVIESPRTGNRATVARRWVEAMSV